MNAATSREKRSSDKGQIENVIALPKRRHGENRCGTLASAFADLAEIAIAAGVLGILALTERNRRIEHLGKGFAQQPFERLAVFGIAYARAPQLPIDEPGRLFVPVHGPHVIERRLGIHPPRMEKHHRIEQRL